MKNFPTLTDAQQEALAVLRSLFYHRATKLYTDQFGTVDIPNCIIGAGVEIFVPKGRRWYKVADWSSSGLTGESEAYQTVEKSIVDLGLVSRYNYGFLD